MYINNQEKEKLYQGLDRFLDVFGLYIISLLKSKTGNDWRDAFVKSLSFTQLQFWEEKEKEGRKPEDLIDFQHLKFFAIRNKDLFRDDFQKKTDRLPTLLEEIVDARNSHAHFEKIEEDVAAKAWINMRTIAKLLGLNELEQEIRHLEKGTHKETHQIEEVAKIVKTLEAIDSADLAKLPDGKKHSELGLDTKKENMIEFIKSAVAKQSELSLKLVEGGHHRIMKTGLRGSLWVLKTKKSGYRIETNGSVGTLLNPEIKLQLGRDYDDETTKGYKIWFVDSPDEVNKIIDIYGQI